MMAQRFIGIMSGTSLDAIDVALLEFNPSMQLLGQLELALPANIRQEIRALNHPGDNEITRCQILSQQLAQLFSQGCNDLLQQLNLTAKDITAIGCHGQTLRHSPEGEHGYSLQIGSGAKVAELTGITTVCDFRSRDIAAGGHGAPLVPAFQKAMFSSLDENRAIVNIGGMANICYLSRQGKVCGFDTGPGNVLMNNWVQENLQLDFDANGAWALTGNVQSDLLAAFLKEPYFAKAAPKSTGRELFDRHWLQSFALENYRPEDVQATLLELSAQSICRSLEPFTVDAIYLCGGGAYNEVLVKRITEISQKPCNTTEAIGGNPNYLEAMAFAWLAKCCLEGQTNNCPEATGAKGPRVLGAIYPQ